MASHSSVPHRSPAQHATEAVSSHRSASLKAFLTVIMGLLSILVFGLSLEYKSILWLWIGFICALIAGFFVQCLINHNRAAR